jgi:radical SAM protein with 4Fe4S-binding SPASM domain
MNVDCHGDDLSSAEYLRRFNRRVAEQNIPAQGSFALTHRCNLRCQHCYVRTTDNGETARNELTTQEAFKILDQCAETGCLSLLLTGGEPLLRPDFREIYTHAKLLGMFVTVFTNGTLVSKEHAEMFADLPPRAVEITLYGATPETYEKVTGIRGSFRRCVDGMERLLKYGVSLRMKTTLLTTNRHELPAMEKMALDYGAKFRFDACIFPRLDGDKFPLTFRTSPEDAAVAELADPERAREWRDFFGRMSASAASDSLYWCAAGITAFHVDANGQLQPCMMVRNVQYNLKGGNFADGWLEVVSRTKDKKAGLNSRCRNCDKKVLCGYCPGFFELESGSEHEPSEYLCRMGHERFSRLGISEDGEGHETRVEATTTQRAL